MPVEAESSTAYSTGGTVVNRGIVRRLNPRIFLTIGSVLFILLVIAALIVFTFLPIFTKTKDDQTKYQVRSEVLKLIYDLPDRVSIISMNWTYELDELKPNKLLILENLLQVQLNKKKRTKKTSITIMDASITRPHSSSTSLLIASPVTSDDNNKLVIIITQPDIDTKTNSTTQLVISLKLRYAFECTKRCQTNLQESIFADTLHSLELPIDTFQALFIEDWKTSTTQFPSNFLTITMPSATLFRCVVNIPSSVLSSSVVTARNYEAESPLNTFIYTVIQSCSICSGEQKVSNIGFTNELIFRQVVSQYGGPTIVIFQYTTDRIRTAEVMVNNMFPSINLIFPSTSLNQTIMSLSVTLQLCQGFNSIRIYNPNDYAPDFDRIVVY